MPDRRMDLLLSLAAETDRLDLALGGLLEHFRDERIPLLLSLAIVSLAASPARMPSAEVNTSVPRSGTVASAAASRERIANQAPGMCARR